MTSRPIPWSHGNSVSIGRHSRWPHTSYKVYKVSSDFACVQPPPLPSKRLHLIVWPQAAQAQNIGIFVFFFHSMRTFRVTWLIRVTWHMILHNNEYAKREFIKVCMRTQRFCAKILFFKFLVNKIYLPCWCSLLCNTICHVTLISHVTLNILIAWTNLIFWAWAACGMTRHVLQGAIQRLLYLPIVYQYTVYSFC